MRALRTILFVITLAVLFVLSCAACYFSAYYAWYWLGLYGAIPIGIAAGGLTLVACSYAWVVAGFALLID